MLEIKTMSSIQIQEATFLLRKTHRGLCHKDNTHLGRRLCICADDVDIHRIFTWHPVYHVYLLKVNKEMKRQATEKEYEQVGRREVIFVHNRKKEDT